MEFISEDELIALDECGEPIVLAGSIVRGFVPLFDDSLKGGVGGGILDFFTDSARSLCSACSSALIGDDEEDDVCDSRTAGRPAASTLSSLC